MPSVKFLVFISSSLADHSVPPVPKFMGSQRRSAHRPKKCSWKMDPLLDSASTLSDVQMTSEAIVLIETEQLPTLTSMLCSHMSDWANSSTWKCPIPLSLSNERMRRTFTSSQLNPLLFPSDD